MDRFEIIARDHAMKWFHQLLLSCVLSLLSLSLSHAAVRGINFTANTTSNTTITITHGISIQSGDMVFLVMEEGGSGVLTFTYPTGFNAVSGLSNVNIHAGDATLGVAVKVAGGAEPSSYTVTCNVGDFMSLAIIVLSGRTGTITASSTTASTAATSFPIAVSATGLTAATGDDIILVTGATGNGSTGTDVLGLTGPTGFGNQGSGNALVANSPPLAWAVKSNSVSGATGTLSASWTKTPGGNPLAYGGYVISVAGSSGTPSRHSLTLLGVGPG